MELKVRTFALAALLLCMVSSAASAQSAAQASVPPGDATASVKAIIDQSIVVFKDQQIS